MALWAVLLWTLSVNPELLMALDGVAVTTKVKGTTQIRPSDRQEFNPLTPATVLFDKDFIRTGSNGFVVLAYLDDKSLLKVKGNSDLEIRGKREGSGISKRIEMTAGTVKADVSEQRKGDFVISTPTSVASVKGTSFWIVSDPVSGDQVFCLDGLVELLNLVSNAIVLVEQGQTGTSASDGSVGVEVTNTNNVPEDEEETGEVRKELRIRFRNADGEERELIIQYD